MPSSLVTQHVPSLDARCSAREMYFVPPTSHYLSTLPRARWRLRGSLSVIDDQWPRATLSSPLPFQSPNSNHPLSTFSLEVQREDKRDEEGIGRTGDWADGLAGNNFRFLISHSVLFPSFSLSSSLFWFVCHLLSIGCHVQLFQAAKTVSCGAS